MYRGVADFLESEKSAEKNNSVPKTEDKKVDDNKDVEKTKTDKNNKKKLNKEK